MNMRQLVLAAAVAGLMAVGCTKHEPPTTERVQEIREVYQTVDPKAKVGTIIAVLPEKGLAAVGNVPLDQVAVGDVMVILDAQQKIIGSGHVVAKTDDAAQISYDVTAQGRQVRVGDMAVKANEKAK